MTPSIQHSPQRPEFLKTPRLFFRRWAETDLTLAIGLWGDPCVTKFIDARQKLTDDDVRSRLEQEIESDRENGIQYWPIFLRSTGEHVGCCGLRPYDPARKILEFGVHIRTDHWRQGYAVEAASEVIDYAFTGVGANGLFAGHNPNNTASRGLLRKLGFRYTHDEYYAPTGLLHPSYLISADDYRSASPSLSHR